MSYQHPAMTRSKKLNDCLRGHGFKIDKDDSDGGYLWQHKTDTDLSVRINQYGVVVEIEVCKDWDSYNHNTQRRVPVPIDEIVAYIDSEMAIFNKRLEEFVALTVEVQYWARTMGVIGKFKKTTNWPFTLGFFCRGYMNGEEEMFSMSIRGKDFLFDHAFYDQVVTCEQDVTKRLLGQDFDDWPDESSPLVFKGKSMFSYRPACDFKPLFFQFGLVGCHKREGVVIRQSEDKALNELLLGGKPVTKEYYEYRFRMPVNRGMFMEVKALADKVMDDI